MSEWKEYRLEDITSKIGSGATPRGGENSYKGQGIALIRSQNVYDYKFSMDGLAYIDEIQAEELKNVEVYENDLLINITGESVTRCCIVPKEILPSRVNQHVAIIRPIKEKGFYKYIYYYLQFIKAELNSMAEIGCTRRALTKIMLNNINIFLPPLPEQKAIASVLSSLDDKIDLLHRQNQTLEAMAETLFRQWFVEEADDKWKSGSLLELINIVGGGTPKTSVSEYWDGNINWLSGGDISANHKSFILYSEKAISEEGLKNSSSKLLPQYATVISARGTVGKYCILAKPMTFSQSNYGIVPHYVDTYFFTYLLVNNCIEELNASAYGSVFDTITTKTFADLEIKIPTANEIFSFEKSVRPYFIKMNTNSLQIASLEKLRNMLLPKLMSGEIKVTL